MPNYYNRVAKLLFSNEAGETLDLSQLHFTFDIVKNKLPVANACTFVIYNIPRNLANSIREQYNQLSLIAGYEDVSGLIFTGQVVRTEFKWEMPSNKLEITAADGYYGITQSVINDTIAEGSDISQVLASINKSFQKFDIKKGTQQPITAGVLSRGIVLFGNTIDQITSLSKSFDFNVSVQEGKLNLVRDDLYLQNEVVTLSGDTGLIGVPDQTLEGIQCRSLLNSKLAVEGVIKLTNSTINRFALDVRVKDRDPAISLDTNGLYKVLQINYVGDNRGLDWYNDIICVGLNNATPRGFELGSRGIV